MDFISLFSLIVLITTLVFFVAVFLFLKNLKLNRDIKIKETNIEARSKEMDSKMYELAILKELGDRVGYSLDVHQIMDVITGSLHQFIEYSAVSYMLLDSSKIIFKIHLEKSVHRGFIDEVRDRMLKSLGALLEKEFNESQVEELISGAILIEEVNEPVQSFFNIPIVFTTRA